MLNNLSQEIRVCLEHAQECARRAQIAGNPSITRGFLDMERCWRSLARSYASAESFDGFPEAQ
jgi:hypothetical protein